MNKSQHTFLTFNRWRGELHSGTSLDHKGLSADEIQQAIDEYVVNKDDLKRSNLELKKIVDELMEENKALRRFKDKWQEQYNSGY